MPDFVVETENAVLMVETKALNEMDNPQVLAKADAAIHWCRNASDYLLKHGGKEWRYLLISHNQVQEHNTLSSYIDRFSRQKI